MPGFAERADKLRKVSTKQILKAALSEMKKAARLYLQTVNMPARWRRAYLRCLEIKEGTKGIVLTLKNPRSSKADRFFTDIVENGVEKGGIDMKPWYKHAVNIPLLHTQRKIRENYRAKGSMSALVRQIRGLGPRERLPAGLVDKVALRHHSDPLAQAMRQQGAFQNAAGQKRGRTGTTVAFRRLSPTPPKDPDRLDTWRQSWIYCPEGREGYHLLPKMIEIFLSIIQRVSREYLWG